MPTKKSAAASSAKSKPKAPAKKTSRKKAVPTTKTAGRVLALTVSYKARCTDENIDLTGWTTKAEADKAAHDHRRDELHTVTVKEKH